VVADGELIASPMTSRRAFTRVLYDYRWILLASLGVVTFVLGCIGYGFDPAVNGPLDVIYQSLALFLPGSTPHVTGAWLQIGRFLGPAVAGYAALSGLASLFRDRAMQMLVPLMRGHVVVCGLGHVGAEFITHLRAAGSRMVVVERDPTNPNIQLCRSWNIPVIVGDAQLERTLHAAGVERADRLLALGPQDGMNTEIIAVAQQLASRGNPTKPWRRRRSGEPLRCLARISAPELCALLRIQEANLTEDPASSSLDFFNIDEISARLWLEEFPIDAPNGRPHLLVSRLDGLGPWLVKHAAAAWYSDRTDDTPLWITVVDDDAEHRIRALVARYPGIEPVCRFIFASTSVRDVHGLAAREDDAAAPPFTRAYVTADSDEQAIEAALRLRHHLDAPVPTVVELWRASGVGRVITEATDSGELTGIEMFPSLVRTCTAELVEGGSFEQIAIAVHNRWCEEQLAADRPAPEWQGLDEALKESSRAQARDIPAKLHSIGCAIAPMRDWATGTQFAFSDEEVEKLAVAEHNRWIRERIDAQWQPAAQKNVEKRLTPYLIPFEKLPADIADFDRKAVRAIPAVLASVDLQVVRLPPPDPDAPHGPH
jgi:hypothetical protein